jgi:pyruvate/2-oxoglutarate dehydrogenase complex dihydrolipoamide dehydrogenase (E3) component
LRNKVRLFNVGAERMLGYTALEEEEGFVKIHVKEGTDKILGATVVARHAGEMINDISLAIGSGIGLRTLEARGETGGRVT